MTDDDETDGLVPTRMINEYVYCPRLFYFEWVDRRFQDNDDTVMGRELHRHVDREVGAAPLPGHGELVAARSVLLGDPGLGVVARIDVVEGDRGSAIPVDFKKGAPTGEDTAWPCDKVQLCLQGLLLRAHGYHCTHGEVYYAEVRRRVHVPFTEARLNQARDLIAEARAVAGHVSPPLPLVDDPKCPRCSLVGLCLPDETNTLLARSTNRGRIIPRDPDARPVYVTEAGASIGVRGGRIEVTRNRETLASIRLLDALQLNVFGRVQVSTQALRELFARQVPILWFSYGGWLQGWASGPPSKYVELRRRQTLANAQGGLGLARPMIEGKIRNCRTLLRRNARAPVNEAVQALGTLAKRAAQAEDFGVLLGIEGVAARLYFEAFPRLIAADNLGDLFEANGRNRRPPRDPVNALLSLCYALLVKDLLAVTLAIGFDPYLGVYHRSRYGRPALALDLAEEFRPLLADSVVLNVLNNKEIRESDFITRAGGVALTSDGRRTVLRAYERRLSTTITHPIFKYKVSYRRVLDVQARLLAAVLVGEVPDYVPMVTR